jgi:hypothetical protein
VPTPAGQADRSRASRLEILGARLGIWTLPRGVEDPPPISRRAVAIAVAVIAAAAVVLVIVVIPAIDDSKDRAATRERRAHDAFVARERARLVAEQAVHRGTSADAARLYRAGRDAAAHAALLAATRADVGRDARARVAAGALDGPIRAVRCAFQPPERGARVHLECLAVTATLVQGTRTTARAGHPFLVAGSLRDGRYAWCKENAPPGEGASGTSVFVPLPAACTT